MSKLTFTPQRDQMDCGPACLSMAASAYGKRYPVEYLREECFLTREGVSLLGITEAAEKIGFECVSAKISVTKLKEISGNFPKNGGALTCILHWNQNHFVVLYKAPRFPKGRGLFPSLLGRLGRSFHIADPSHGFIKLPEKDFRKSWLSDDEKGIVLFLQPTENFYHLEPPGKNKNSLRYLFSYLKEYSGRLLGMFFMLLAGSALTLVFPFLQQNLIDKGVTGKNLNIITLILLAQLALFFGSIVMEIIRNRLMLYVGTKLSIRIISDFLKKLLALPIKFFDTKMQGDFQQRIQDNERIENFLTSQSLLTFFSIITFSVFFGVLWYYNVTILLIYLFLTVLSIFWSIFWLKKRRILDYFRFQERSRNQESIYEMLNGVTEMKLNNFADYKRYKWEEIQQKLFKINIRILRLDQFQMSGFEFINQLKNIVVTFFAAALVIKGNITLGIMLSISYIIGQMNSPVNQLIGFFRGLQDAKLSLERLNEVQNHPEEEQEGQLKSIQPATRIGIKIENLSFRYGGTHSPFVLKNINLEIPESKITAIVGASGSGKTTLVKLLLKFYDITNGNIFYNNLNINNLSAENLRKNIGVVMQDGYIFSDTIERNIATSDENIDEEKLERAVQTANIERFIESLPLKYNTKIGAAGNGISGGQQQRILIARAVYKNPHYIFFDEATSALDAENEKIIHDNLQEFFRGKTVLIIAHRLSTVKNADQIIVLKEGEIAEQGTHAQLVENKGEYFNLVKNQLELGTG
ncbi:MAG: peptidase domain-containing ABC transporter [Candidatus Azobacteroides sp.]|nr:peptidase domain-containing ABC transporter [Candidatus Azobacteroides sp.]